MHSVLGVEHVHGIARALQSTEHRAVIPSPLRLLAHHRRRQLDGVADEVHLQYTAISDAHANELSERPLGFSF